MDNEEFENYENYRMMTPDFTPSDSETESSLRPKILGDYIGQDKVKENLGVYIEAALKRGEPLDHVFALRSSRPRKNDACGNYR